MDDERDDDERVALALDPRVALKALLAVDPQSPPAPTRETDKDSRERDEDQ